MMNITLGTNSTQSASIRGIRDSQRVINDSTIKLTTGSRIASAKDGGADLSRISALSAQVQTLNQAVRNIDAALLDLETADIALDEVSDLLVRMQEIAVEAASDATSTTQRTTLSQEMSQLNRQIDFIASSTSNGNQHLLNGSYSGKEIFVGNYSNDTVSSYLISAKPSSLGSYSSLGPTREALAAAQSAAANTTSDSEDILLQANGSATTINVADADSAKAVAEKINALSYVSQVTATAQTYAHLFSTNGSSANYTVTINGTSTSAFSISSSNVTDAVSKINLISASTGVTALATTDNKVLLHDSTGGDITIENAQSGSDLDVQAVQSDGVTPQGGSAISLAAGAGSNNDSTRVIGTLRLSSDIPFNITQSGNSSLGYTVSGTAELSDLNTVDLSTANTSAASITILSEASKQISTIRGHLASIESRLDFAQSLTARQVESKELHINKINDVDFAMESAKLAKAMVLQQTSSALLAQANAGEELVIKLVESAA